MDGLWIGTAEKEPESILRRVEEGLLLIKTYDPRRYNRLRQDLARIWVRMLIGLKGHFNERLRACELDTRYVLADQTTAADIASTIVHEATHARIDHAGIPYAQELRPRIEAACFRQQIAFARRVPNGAAIRERAEQWLTVSESYWNDETLKEQQHAAAAEGLRQLGMPNWMIEVFSKLRPVVKAIRRLASGLTRA